MPDTVYESQLRITHNPTGAATVLLDWGDDVAGEPTLDGGQAVDVVTYARGSGVKTFDRGNESHTLSIPLEKETGSIRDAHNQLFTGALAVPRNTADVLIEVQGGVRVLLKDATVQDWNALTESHFTGRVLTIIGGTLSLISSAVTFDSTVETFDSTVWTFDQN